MGGLLKGIIKRCANKEQSKLLCPGGGGAGGGGGGRNFIALYPWKSPIFVLAHVLDLKND